jgi:hypothetical protein
MNAHAGDPRGQTLGACLSKLSAGNPCPCCGAPLRIRYAIQPVRAMPAAGVGEVGPTAVLSCSECGCEVSAGDGAEDVGGFRFFCAAA